MSRQQIEISRLMNDYIDEEFNISGKAAASAGAVKKAVMKQAEPKRNIRIFRKAAIIAAAVAAVGTLTAAALPYGFLKSQTGAEYEFSEYESRTKTPGIDIDADLAVLPYSVEDGKVYFTADNQHIDITEYMGSGHNYFYKYCDTDNQGGEYVIVMAVGGEIDDPAYGEMVFQKDGHHLGAANYIGGGETFCYYKDGNVIMADSEEAEAESLEGCPWRTLKYPCWQEFDYYQLKWAKDISNGEEIDLSEADGTLVFETKLSDWHYPEGWTGEMVEE